MAFSRNPYAWSDRIDPEKGLIRLVFGLGTRAVNRVPDDYPRMIAVSQPRIRPEAGAKIAHYSQHKMDLLDLEADCFCTVPVAELLRQGDYPQLHYYTSLLKEGFPFDPPYREFAVKEGEGRVLTFNRLINGTAFVALLGEMLERLEQAYGHPVDTEFTATLDEKGAVRINLLQCRPLWLPQQMAPLELPATMPAERVLFRAKRVISPGLVEGIKYIIYVDPRRYGNLNDSLRKQVGRLVGALNRHPDLAGEKLLLMGPGRWGSSNIRLGVNASYADLNNAAALVELACENAGQLPEVSYGTHFFQDLVESQITYLPVYPDLPEAEFNYPFFQDSPSVLEKLQPESTPLADVVRVINVPAVSAGLTVRLVANPRSRQAVCYLG